MTTGRRPARRRAENRLREQVGLVALTGQPEADRCRRLPRGPTRAARRHMKDQMTSIRERTARRCVSERLRGQVRSDGWSARRYPSYCVDIGGARPTSRSFAVWESISSADARRQSFLVEVAERRTGECGARGGLRGAATRHWIVDLKPACRGVYRSSGRGADCRLPRHHALRQDDQTPS